MALTRANVETILIRRSGALMTAAGLDGTTVAGTNVDLNDPIGVAIVAVGGSVTSRVLVADADVATVATASYDQFLDIAEYRLLQNISGNLSDVDITVGPRSEKLSQLATHLNKMLDRKKDALENQYGYNAGTLEAGVLTLSFADHDEDVVDEGGN